MPLVLSEKKKAVSPSGWSLIRNGFQKKCMKIESWQRSILALIIYAYLNFKVFWNISYLLFYKKH